MNKLLLTTTVSLGFLFASNQTSAATTEFCIDGKYDLGARYQGFRPRAGEYYPASWCVVTEDASDRVLLSMTGRSNPDIDGAWSVAFLPPELVRIVNGDSPPDIEFRTSKSVDEAARTRRMDPRRVVEELTDSEPDGFTATIVDGRLLTIETTADLPLRGRVPVIWRWSWKNPEAPELRLAVDGNVILRGVGSWKELENTSTRWKATSGADPVDVPGEQWPSRVAMELVGLSESVYLVKNVRTGFQHLVIDTDDGLVVGDAPAGWVELHQVPPKDLVPGLGISGLSERFVEFLAEKFPERPLRAVVLTHHHDDHAGGARAFAAVGAQVYAPDSVAGFLEVALNRDGTPADSLTASRERVTVTPISATMRLDDDQAPVDIVPIGSGPHAEASLGVLAGGWFFQSDLHVPNSDADEPTPVRHETECWFAGWAVANLPEDAIIINSHGAQKTPVSRLARYLESRLCSDSRAGQS